MNFLRNVAAVLIAVLFLVGLLLAVLLGSSEQRQIVSNCINEILGTIS
ncbi:hypothetical protein SAMN05216353_13935 [Halobacillus alkaliphilus]|uniref:Uncharacterized protein n=1 Tax=Halobacillus alkaliphilus TaxID=396056 RepID=A0A1I2REY6_9BACI|nr:hypothetical protein [Halobacillus alkaliphilus]SFG39108.1 hypothetical protein SAMN05216353_13935 [Halobacillus alkaliphilus]